MRCDRSKITTDESVSETVVRGLGSILDALWDCRNLPPARTSAERLHIPFPLFARVPITAVDFAPKIGWRLLENTSTSFREDPGNEVENTFKELTSNWIVQLCVIKSSHVRVNTCAIISRVPSRLEKSCKIEPGFETSLANECLRKDMFIIYLHVLNTLQLLVDEVFKSTDY